MGLFAKRKNSITIGKGTRQPRQWTEEELQDAYPGFHERNEQIRNEQAAHEARLEAIKSDRPYSEIEP